MTRPGLRAEPSEKLESQESKKCLVIALKAGQPRNENKSRKYEKLKPVAARKAFHQSSILPATFTRISNSMKDRLSALL